MPTFSLLTFFPFNLFPFLNYIVYLMHDIVSRAGWTFFC
jgi:hypothetical protein